MSRHNRDEDKKRRRKKRLEKRARAAHAAPDKAVEQLDRVIATVERHLAVPEPAHWPGGGDPTLARPDLLKLELGQFALERSPGREKARQFEDGCRQGFLHFLPEIDHWSWEEFLYHGRPGDSWHPIEAYLAQAGERYPPAAAEQLRRWKQARIGLYEIGDVADDTLGLREWHGLQRTAAGPPLRAITLNIGGVNLFRGQQGKILLSYLAPWHPEANLYCGMGYSQMAEPRHLTMFLPYLGLRHPEVVGRPLPWGESPAAADKYLRAWRSRDWLAWLRARLTFPFLALVSTPPKGEQSVLEVKDLLPATTEQGRRFGIYFEVPMKGGETVLAAGGTHVTPLEVASDNRLALAEYHAFRERVGQPPGVRGQPTFLDL